MTWKYEGIVLGPSEQTGWDDGTTWTGSVVKSPDGKWMMFYTGTQLSESRKYQRIGAAVSDDLFSRTDLTAEWVAPELDVSGWVAPMRLELDCGSAAIVTVGEARASFALSADTSALVHGAPVLAKACGGDLTTAQSGPVLVRAEAGPGLAVRALVLARPLEVSAASIRAAR